MDVSLFDDPMLPPARKPRRSFYGSGLPLMAALVTGSQADARGYSDKMAGLGFPEDYDTWGIQEQRNYELGRQRAAGERATVD